MTSQILLVCLSYLVGSIPFGLIVSKQLGVDVRKAGSGNIGATNVLRTTGRLGGALTLLGDSIKGFLPVLFAKSLWGMESVVLWVGLAAVIGHTFPVFLKFKGGKGVATSFGVLWGLWPLIGLITLILWVVTIKVSSYSSLSALVSFAVLPVVVWVMIRTTPAVLFSAAITGLLFFRHRGNIRRLCRGEEAKIGPKK